MARRLDRLQAANMGKQGLLTWAQRVCEQIETALDGIDEELGALAAAQAAQASADAAQTTATAAQTTADTVQRDDAIADSITIPGEILTATDAGTDATITIANHTRQYNDGLSRAITGASITALSYSTLYYIYYDKTTRAAGAQTYHATTTAKTALPATAAGRHFCGSITTPGSGGGGTTGGYTPPSGGGDVRPANIA